MEHVFQSETKIMSDVSSLKKKFHHINKRKNINNQRTHANLFLN